MRVTLYTFSLLLLGAQSVASGWVYTERPHEVRQRVEFSSSVSQPPDRAEASCREQLGLVGLLRVLS